MYIDAHIHLMEFSENEIISLLREKKYLFISVAEDINSSIENIKLGLKFEEVIPCIGIHPWNVKDINKEGLEYFKELIEKYNIKILGEIGLDLKFHPETFDKQKEVFNFFIDLAKEYDLSINLHSPDAWRECFDILIKKDIKFVYFHWYTGPLDLLKEIESVGYLVGINIAALFQEKHRKIIEEVNINNVLTESDAPYIYKGNILHPRDLNKLYSLISNIKNISESNLQNILRKNASKLLYHIV